MTFISRDETRGKPAAGAAGRRSRTARALAAVGAGVTLLASSGLAWARGADDHGPPDPAVMAQVEFTDLAQVQWAQPAIGDLVGQCILEGEGQRRFLPNGLTTRAQIAVLLARLLGLRPGQLMPQVQSGDGAHGDQHGDAADRGAVRRNPGVPRGLIQALDQALAKFRDQEDIPAWARTGVGLAAAIGLLQGDQTGRFLPAQQVTWAQAAAILERIFHFPAVPADQVPADLARLPNGSATPAWAQRAVASEVAAGVFTGQVAQDYAPMAAIDRADLAALVENAEMATARPVGRAAQLVTGRVVAVGSSALTLLSGCGLVNVPLLPVVTVYANGGTSNLAAVAVGDVVLVGLQSGQGLFIDVLAPRPPVPQGTVSGTVASVASTQVAISANGRTTTYALEPTVAVSGLATSLSAVQVGDQVMLTLDSNGAVSAIDVTAVPAPTTSVSGTVTSINGAFIAITESNGASAAFVLAPGVSVSGQVGSLAALMAGDQVTLTINGSGQVTAIGVTALPSTTQVSGSVSAVTASQITLTESDGSSVSFALAPNVQVTGLVSSLSAVMVGDRVTVTVTASGQVTAIEVTALPATTVSGTIQAISPASVTVATSGAQDLTFQIAPGVATSINGTACAFSQVQVGDTATLSVNSAGRVAAINVTAPPPATSTVGGSLLAVSTSSASVTVATYNASTGAFALDTLDLASIVDVSLGGSGSTLDKLQAGDAVTLGVDAAGDVVAITATPPPQGAPAASGVVDSNGNGQIGVYTSGGQQVYVPYGPAPLGVMPRGNSWTMVAVANVVIGTHVTAIGDGANRNSLLLLVQ